MTTAKRRSARPRKRTVRVMTDNGPNAKLEALVRRFDGAVDALMSEIARLEKGIKRSRTELWLCPDESFDQALGRALAAQPPQVQGLLNYLLAKLGERLPPGREVVPVVAVEARFAEAYY